MLGKLKAPLASPANSGEFENLELEEEAALLSLIEHESLKLASGSLVKRSSTRKPRIILIPESLQHEDPPCLDCVRFMRERRILISDINMRGKG